MYRYNFQTRERVRADPNNLVTPPNAEKDKKAAVTNAEEETEEAAAAAALQAADNANQPGAADLLSSHAAIKAAEGAVFDVPPPLHIKFASPAVVQPSRFQTTALEDFKHDVQRSMGGN